MENANVCMYDKTASVKLFNVYTFFQFVTSCWINMQQNRIENWVLDTFGKNFVTLAFYDTFFNHTFFDKLRFDKNMLQNE